MHSVTYIKTYFYCSSFDKQLTLVHYLSKLLQNLVKSNDCKVMILITLLS